MFGGEDDDHDIGHAGDGKWNEGRVDDRDEKESEESEEEAKPDVSEQQRQAAKASIEDFTKNIQRKKEKELAALQFVGGEASPQKQPVLAKKTAGRNDPCPCGSGKKYKKCCGA